MNHPDSFTFKPSDSAHFAPSTIKQLMATHSHLVSMGLANSRAAWLVRSEINLRFEVRRRLEAQGIALANYDPDEPRDWHGRWTTEDNAGNPKTNSPSQPPARDVATTKPSQAPPAKPS